MALLMFQVEGSSDAVREKNKFVITVTTATRSGQSCRTYQFVTHVIMSSLERLFRMQAVPVLWQGLSAGRLELTGLRTMRMESRRGQSASSRSGHLDFQAVWQRKSSTCTGTASLQCGPVGFDAGWVLNHFCGAAIDVAGLLSTNAKRERARDQMNSCKRAYLRSHRVREHDWVIGMGCKRLQQLKKK